MSTDIIKIAIMAVGGQGGGVLCNWIAELAKGQAYRVQTTSVAGVAQRTGATISYIEMAPAGPQLPVFALSPSPGDVDIVIAAELMEAGRAILRGFVTPTRTTLIASSHRILSVAEKQKPGDGRVAAEQVFDAIETAALKNTCFDMQSIATEAGTVISASLFGALAKSGSLAFAAEHFENVLRSGDNAEKNLAAFRTALNYQPDSDTARSKSLIAVGPKHLLQQWRTLLTQVNDLPESVQSMAKAGLEKTVDYQDIDYGREYLERLAGIIKLDNDEKNHELSVTAAKYIANAMCYDDIPRVAELKTRSSRDRRIRQEMHAGEQQILHVREYFHPREEELLASLPVSMNNWLQRHNTMRTLASKLFGRGHRLRSDGIVGFTLLWIIAGLKPHRRKLARHQRETQHLDELLERVSTISNSNYHLAVAVLECQRLIKGYADTHARGESKFDKLMNAEQQIRNSSNAAQQLRALCQAALEDEQGELLDRELVRLGIAQAC